MAIDHELRQRPWILLSGTLCTGAVFDAFLDELGVSQAQRHVVDLSHPDVNDYLELLAPLSKDAVVCGFSLGALVAAHHADQLSAACLILFGLNPFADAPEKAQGRRDLALDVATKGGAHAMMSRLPPLYGANPDRVRETLLAMADTTANQVDAHVNLSLSRPGAMDVLAQSATPVMFLTGSDDKVTTPAQGQAAAKVTPRGHFRLLPKLGHYALLEDPHVCAQAVLDLEKELASGSQNFS